MNDALDSAVRLDPQTFDYSCIADKNTRFAAADAAANVRNGLSNQAEIIIEVGTILIDAKENLLPHGCFNDWLRLELALNPRTAQQYMSVARHFASKPATVAHLKPTTLYLLSSDKNECARREVLRRLEAGELLDDAGVRQISEIMRPEPKPEAVKVPLIWAAPVSTEMVSFAASGINLTDRQQVDAYSQLTGYLAPRCYGEIQHLIALVRNAGFHEFAAFMVCHHNAAMTDVTRLFTSSLSTGEDPTLFD